MKIPAAMALARGNLRRNLKGAILSSLGVAVGVACLAFFTSLGAGVSKVVRERIFPVDESTIEVIPPQVSMGAFLGGGVLDDAMKDRFLKLPGVAEAWPKMAVRVGAISRYNGAFFGRPLRVVFEVMAVGADTPLIAKGVAAGKRFEDAPNGPVPVVISTRLLELYNKSFAAQRNLPKLTPDLLTGFQFSAEMGRSFVTDTVGTPQDVTFEVVGFSPRALLGGVTLPLETARRLNRQFGQDDKTYTAIVLRATSPDELPGLAAEVRRMGFDIDDSEQRLAEQVGWGIAVVTAALALLSVLIALLAAVNIAHAFYASVRERRREIGVLRAVGATQRDVMRILLSEAAIIGASGAAAGLVAALVLARIIDFAATRVLPDFPFKPDSFFGWSIGIILGSLAIGVLAAIGGAFAPARGAATSEPAEALAE